MSFQPLRIDIEKDDHSDHKGQSIQPEPETPESEEKLKSSDIIVNIGLQTELFHDPDGETFATIDNEGHKETWPLRSKAFKQWLGLKYYQKTKSAPNSEALQSGLAVLEGKARFEGEEHKVFVRTGKYREKYYLDLGDPKWRAVEIDADGWRIVDDCPAKFRRQDGTLPLPTPVQMGSSINDLRKFLNLKSDSDFELIKAWLLTAIRADGPFPILAFSGEQGSAKSTASRILRTFIDPKKISLATFPRNERDLFIAATNGHLLAFDNVSKVSDWISDSLCRLSTGGGFATRKLHTDSEEAIFDAQRPILMNGIGDFLHRPDAADRAIIINLEPIAEKNRQTEASLWRNFEAVTSGIFANLLDCMVGGLARHPHIVLDRAPRMADFAKWAIACEEAHSHAGAFTAAYEQNRVQAVQILIDNDEVASGVKRLLESLPQPEWTGSATELLNALIGKATENEYRGGNFPKSAAKVSERLKRAAPPLRKIGIEASFNRVGDSGSRVINIYASL